MKNPFKKFALKQYFTIFLILLVPACLRHLAYYDTYASTGVYPSVSPESKAFFDNDMPLMFFVEEALLSSVIALLYFARTEWTRILAFGYLIDPIIDIISSIYTKMTSLIFLPNFILRELILPYAVIGLILTFTFKDLKKVWRTVYVMTSGLLLYLVFIT